MPPLTGTVRFRLTVWYSSLLLVFGTALVVSLNIAVRLDHSGGFYIPPGSTVTADVTLRPERLPSGQTGLGAELTLKDAADQIRSANLDQLRNWSIVAVVGLALASGVGGWLLSGVMLAPVRDITQVASEIGAGNLKRRINHRGPDDELKALADTFDSMIDRLEHSFDQQRAFVQHASHELRTPLAAIRTNIEVTELDPDVSPEEYRSLLETIKTQTARLTRLSEDLLLLSANEEEERTLEPVNLAAVSREVVGQLATLAATRGIELRSTGEPVWALADPDAIFRCVFNLVDNAIKYSGDNALVTASVTSGPEEVAVAVRDTGPGIAPEQMERIFDRFYRIDKSLSRRAGGAGLGLSIVRDLAESMGGSVTVESQVGLGSTFTVHLRPVPLDDLDWDDDPAEADVAPLGQRLAV